MVLSELGSVSLWASLIIVTPLLSSTLGFDGSGFLPPLKEYLVLEKHS